MAAYRRVVPASYTQASVRIKTVDNQVSSQRSLWHVLFAIGDSNMAGSSPPETVPFPNQLLSEETTGNVYYWTQHSRPDPYTADPSATAVTATVGYGWLASDPKTTGAVNVGVEWPLAEISKYFMHVGDNLLIVKLGIGGSTATTGNRGQSWNPDVVSGNAQTRLLNTFKTSYIAPAMQYLADIGVPDRYIVSKSIVTLLGTNDLSYPDTAHLVGSAINDIIDELKVAISPTAPNSVKSLVLKAFMHYTEGSPTGYIEDVIASYADLDGVAGITVRDILPLSVHEEDTLHLDGTGIFNMAVNIAEWLWRPH